MPSNDPSGSTPATGIQTILTKPNGYRLPTVISARANPQPLPLSQSMTREQAIRWLLAFQKQMRSELSSNLLSVAKRDNAEAGNLELYKNPFGLLYAPLMPGISSPTEAEMIEARSSSSKSAATNMKKEQDKHRQKLLVILKSKDEQQDERQPPRKFPMSAPDPPKPGDEIPAGRVTCDSCGKQHAGVCWFDVRKTNNAGSVHEERRNQVPGADGGERTRGRSRSSSRNRSNSDRGSHEATPSRFQPRPPQEGGSKD